MDGYRDGYRDCCPVQMFDLGLSFCFLLRTGLLCFVFRVRVDIGIDLYELLHTGIVVLSKGLVSLKSVGVLGSKTDLR